MFESALAYPLAFMVAIGLLVTVHEYGHFRVARWCGVRVLRFSIGFGRPLFRWQRTPDSTEYVIGLIPLGGYVKMLDSADESSSDADRNRALDQKPVSQRAAIAAAGPIANFFFAILAYWAMYTIGVPALTPIIGEVAPHSVAAQAGINPGAQILAVNKQRVETWKEAHLALLQELSRTGEAELTLESGGVTEVRLLQLDNLLDQQNMAPLTAAGISPYRPELAARLGELTPDGAAEQAGLQANDLILASDNGAIDNWSQWVAEVRENPGVTLTITILRAGQEITLQLTPAPKETEQGIIGFVGVRAADAAEWPDGTQVLQRFPLHQGIGKAISQAVNQSSFTLWFLGQMVTGNAALDNLSGPVTIAKYAGESARMGAAPFLEFLALISISLGILNLLPIPVLDGGHLVYYCAEAIRGKPLPESVRLAGQQGGVVILLGLTVIALYNDLVRLFS